MKCQSFYSQPKCYVSCLNVKNVIFSYTCIRFHFDKARVWAQSWFCSTVNCCLQRKNERWLRKPHNCLCTLFWNSTDALKVLHETSRALPWWAPGTCIQFFKSKITTTYYRNELFTTPLRFARFWKFRYFNENILATKTKHPRILLYLMSSVILAIL